MLGHLPGLERLDGKTVENSERIEAAQRMDQIKPIMIKQVIDKQFVSENASHCVINDVFHCRNGPTRNPVVGRGPRWRENCASVEANTKRTEQKWRRTGRRFTVRRAGTHRVSKWESRCDVHHIVQDASAMERACTSSTPTCKGT